MKEILCWTFWSQKVVRTVISSMFSFCIRLFKVKIIKYGNNLMKTIQIKLLSVFWWNLVQMLPKRNGWTLLILEIKVKFTIGKRLYSLVNTKEVKLLSVFWSNLAHVLRMISGWTVLISEVKGQGQNMQQWKSLSEHNRDQTIEGCLTGLQSNSGLWIDDVRPSVCLSVCQHFG